MANISVVGRIVSDDIELKISANNRPYLRFDLAERTGKGAYARTQYYQVVAFGANQEPAISITAEDTQGLELSGDTNTAMPQIHDSTADTNANEEQAQAS